MSAIVENLNYFILLQRVLMGFFGCFGEQCDLPQTKLFVGQQLKYQFSSFIGRWAACSQHCAHMVRGKLEICPPFQWL